MIEACSGKSRHHPLAVQVGPSLGHRAEQRYLLIDPHPHGANPTTSTARSLLETGRTRPLEIGGGTVNGIELGQRVADVVGRQQLGKVLWSKRLRGRDRSLPQKASALYVCEQGCVLGDASDCVADRFRWADVTEFTKKISELRVQKTLDVTPRHKSTDYRFTFKLPDRTVTLKGTTSKLWVSAFDGFSELVSPLVCAAQLPGMLAALRCTMAS